MTIEDIHVRMIEELKSRVAAAESRAEQAEAKLQAANLCLPDLRAALRMLTNAMPERRSKAVWAEADKLESALLESSQEMRADSANIDILLRACGAETVDEAVRRIAD